MRRHDGLDGGRIVGFGNYVIQAHRVDVEAVAEEYGGDAPVEKVS